MKRTRARSSVIFQTRCWNYTNSTHLNEDISFRLLSHQNLTMPTDLKWSLKDKIIHWNIYYQHCEFPRESDALYQAPSYASSTSSHVHHGKSLQQYLNEDRIHQECMKIAKKFEYQEWSKEIPSRKVCCLRRCHCEQCIQKKDKFT